MESGTRRDVIKVGSTGLIASVAGCTEQMSESVYFQGEDTPTPDFDAFSEEELSRAKTLGKEARKAVVVIRGDNGSSGTAWFHDDGDLITNSHVVEHNDSFEAWSIDGEKFTPEVVGASDHGNHPFDDVAVLETDFSPKNELSLGESTAVEKGQPLIQIGHPFGVGNWVISIGKYVEKGLGEKLRTSVPSLSGNSGAPLLTLDGSVVGITTGGVPREKLGSMPPKPVDLEVYEVFTDYKWATHDSTSVISQYIEEF